MKIFSAYLRYLLSIDVIRSAIPPHRIVWIRMLSCWIAISVLLTSPLISDRFGSLANQSQHLVTMYSLRAQNAQCVKVLPTKSTAKVTVDLTGLSLAWKSVPLLPGLLHKYHVRLCLTRQILHDDASLLLLSITRSVVTLAASLMHDRAVAFMLFVALGLQ